MDKRKDYLSLLARRESKEVLGHNFSNLWILTAVLLVVFVAVSFSWAGKKFLENKMSDPFVNWINIPHDAAINDKYLGFVTGCSNPDVLKKYHIGSFSGDYFLWDNFFNAYQEPGNSRQLDCRFFSEFAGRFTQAVMDSSQVVNGSSSVVLNNNTLGLIITEEALTKKLGYSKDSIPAFIYLQKYVSEENLSEDSLTLGQRTISSSGQCWFPTPFPLLGVVKKLPMNMDIMGSGYWYCQFKNTKKYPFDIINNETHYNVDKVYYFVCRGYESIFNETVYSIPTGKEKKPEIYSCANTSGLDYLRPWSEGEFYQVYYGTTETPKSERVHFDLAIQEALKNKHVGNCIYRIYKYDVSDYKPDDYSAYSVLFNDLGLINDFEKYVKNEYDLQIELSQTSSRKTFQIVSTIANVLTIVMIVFAVICIVMYIINMLQSYFQKVKRNLGTFKAFGMESKSLIRVYAITLLLIISVAILIALAITILISGVLRLIHVVWETGYPFFLVSNPFIYISIIVIIAASIITVSLVMRRLLSQTPGDLIYDR